MAKNEVQDTLLEVDSTLQSPVHRNLKKDVKIDQNLGEGGAMRKKNMRMINGMKMLDVLENSGLAHKMAEKGGLSSASQTNIMSTLSLSDECHEQEKDDELNKVQNTVQEPGSSVKENLEESKICCSKGKIMSSLETGDDVVPVSGSSSGLVQKEENLFSDKRAGFIKKARERKVRSITHEGKTSDSTSYCDYSSMQMAEKNGKFEDELEQTVEGSLVFNENPLEVSLAESKGEEKMSSSDVDVTKHFSLAVISEEDNLLEVLHSSPYRAPAVCFKRKLLILDVNGLLADILSPAPKDYKADVKIARRAIFKRPFCFDFLKFCFERFDVGVWSSRSKKIIDRVIDYLMGDMKHKLLFCWNLSHCTETGFNTLENKHKALVFKELRKIWEKDDTNLPWEKGDYNESNSLLLDDSPYKALLNPLHTAIFPYSYKFQDRSDNSLGPGGDIRVYLEELVAADNIQKYVEQHPFGQSTITETSSSWGFYHKGKDCSVLCTMVWHAVICDKLVIV